MKEIEKLLEKLNNEFDDLKKVINKIKDEQERKVAIRETTNKISDLTATNIFFSSVMKEMKNGAIKPFGKHGIEIHVPCDSCADKKDDDQDEEEELKDGVC